MQRLGNRLRRTLVLLLVLALLTGLAAPGAAAPELPQAEDFLKITNPQNGEGEPDGLLGENRTTSYAWSLTERDGKLYIGTNTNLGGAVIQLLQNAFASAGVALSADMVWAAIDVLTNCELPHPEAGYTGTILVYTLETGEICELPGARDVICEDCSIRNAILYGGDIYFATYNSASFGASPCQILKLDRSDTLCEVFSSSEGSSMRACCVLDGKLYFAGADSALRGQFPAREGDNAMLTVLCRDETAPGGWTRAADYRDFGDYAADPYVLAPAGAPVWDLCAFDGGLWATLPGKNGYIIFEGHPARPGEVANDYGWVWTEIVGRTNGRNNPGLADDPNGYSVDGSYDAEPLLSVISSLVVYRGELFVYDLDHAIMGAFGAIGGMLGVLAGGKASAIVGPMYRTLMHPQRVCRYNRETGVFEEMTDFTETVSGTCNEYLWRAQEYDGALYLGTLDASVFYSYLTQLTLGSFLQWDAAQWQRELGAIREMLDQLAQSGGQDNKYVRYLTQILETLESLLSMLDSDIQITPEIAQYILDNWDMILRNIEQLLLDLWEQILAEEDAVPARDLPFETLVKTILAQLVEDLGGALETGTTLLGNLVNAFDMQALEQYVAISEIIQSNAQGCDVLRSEDGEHWQLVVEDGFGDRYNYGAARFAVTGDGLYIGTQNPFYGAQLWLMPVEGYCPKDFRCPMSAFSDLDPHAWYHDGVHACLENGVMNGISDTLFAPDRPTTRAQLVTMLWRSAGQPAPAGRQTAFTDLKPGSYYETAVLWAVENGIVTGYSPTRFGPDEPLTREQLAVILYRCAGVQYAGGSAPLAGFADRDEISSWAEDAVCWAVSVGLLRGVSATALSPAGSATRAQVATLLTRFEALTAKE